MGAFPIKDKPPHNVNVLERWLNEASKQTGIAAGRLRRWMGFMVLAAMLDQVRLDADGEPLFLVKGGFAMELRITTGARATKDLDTAFRDNMEAVADRLDPALRTGYGDFTATRTELERVRDTGTVRCSIKLAYRGRSVITVPMEVAAAEGSMGDEIDHLTAKSLDHLGLVGPDTVPCLAVRWQIAQKLHACTEVFDQGENHRFRDLIDFQLLETLIDDGEWVRVRAACVEVFEGRRKHDWPPEISIAGSWEEGYRALAHETGFAVDDVLQAADAVRKLIARIELAR